MKIEYTYAEPQDRPIKKAEFRSSVDNDECQIKCIENEPTAVLINVSSYAKTLLLTKADFADFTALVNRINKQINE